LALHDYHPRHDKVNVTNIVYPAMAVSLYESYRLH
jgi:hypothetical protein